MATRGSAMSRAIKFFKEEDLDVALVALTHIRNIVEARSRNERTGMDKPVKRGRKPKSHVEVVRVGHQEDENESESLANA